MGSRISTTPAPAPGFEEARGDAKVRRIVARPVVVNVVAALLPLAAACGGAPKKDVAPDDQAKTILLAVDTPFAELVVPEDSRGELGPPPAQIPLRGWSAGGSNDAGASASTDMPIRTRNLYFFKPSPGMRMVKRSGEGWEEIPHKYFKSSGPHWTYDDKKIRIHGWEGEPSDGELFLEYEAATKREAELNQKYSGKDANTFVKATVQAGNESRTGLLLPAPARAAWDVEIPPAADLRFAAAMIRPEVADGPTSDGAAVRVTLTVTGESGATEHEIWRGDVRGDAFKQQKIDLAAWAGKSGRLLIETLPGDAKDARFDYVFLADPVIASRKAHPRHVFFVFVDTLRADHVGTFGYERDTTPALDRLAANAARFSQARNVAPWTLPSTRSVLTGVDPEYYFDTPTIQGRLREAGFASAMFAGNLYLSANFGLNRDWGLHFVELLPRAKPQVDRALEWLDENQDRDLFMLVHLMDAHLPYKEPTEYRRMFAGDAPEALKRDEFHRDHVMNAHLKTKEERQYVRDRYDNNIRYADDQLARLYERMGPDDILVFFSDHGEEFWDHGGLEHGHTLFDELLHVPLVIKAPGLEAGVVDAPVSLLDVVPTVLDLLDLPAGELKGSSLVPLANGESGVAKRFLEREQAFGRPLYGGERWGVIAGDRKYTTFNGNESVFDIGADPTEKKDLRDGDPSLAAPMREALHTALNRDVVEAWRVAARGTRKFPEQELVARVTVAGGIRAAWVGEDPTESSDATLAWKDGDATAVITWPKNYRGSRDVWIVPKDPIAAATPKLVVEATCGDAKARITPPPDAPTAPTGERALVMTGAVGDRTLDVGFGIMPIPDPNARATSGYDPELQSQLTAMGYAVGGGGEAPPEKPEPKKPPGGDGKGSDPAERGAADPKTPGRKPED